VAPVASNWYCRGLLVGSWCGYGRAAVSGGAGQLGPRLFLSQPSKPEQSVTEPSAVAESPLGGRPAVAGSVATEDLAGEEGECAVGRLALLCFPQSVPSTTGFLTTGLLNIGGPVKEPVEQGVRGPARHLVCAFARHLVCVDNTF
jgi:hypothetical protein